MSLRGGWLFFWVLCVAATSCAPQPVSIPAGLPPDALVLRPGDSLLEHVERFTVSAYPATNLPEAVGKRLSDLWAGEPWSVGINDWLGGAVLPAEAAAALGFEPAGELRRWRCHPALRLDLGAGRLEFVHEQRSLRPLFQASAARELQWKDDEAQLLFWWVESEGSLVALGSRPPGPLSSRYVADSDEGLARYERVLVAGAAVEDAETLLSRGRVGAVDRPSLAAPASTTLRMEIDCLAGDSLRVAMAVDDLGLGWSASPTPAQREHRGWLDDPRLGLRRLSPREGLGDGVVFSVEVTLDGLVYPVWSRRVEPHKGWREDTVDLSFFAGQEIDLALITGPGAEGAAEFDHALWADLTIEGVSDGPPLRPHIVLVDVPGLRSSDEVAALAQWSSVADSWDAVSAPATDRFSGVLSLLNGRAPAGQGTSSLEPASLDPAFIDPQFIDHGAELVASLAAAGYETIARTEGGHLVPELGFAHRFSRFDYQRLDLDKFGGGDWSRELARASARRSARPMFLFLSSAQMLPPSSDDVDALAQLDRLLDELLQNIDAAFHGEPTLVVLTSDHPRPELRDSAFGGQGLDAATVPLLMRWPPGWRASTQFREGRAAVTTLDVAATILHVAGVETAPAMTGTSLAEH